jgi:hypothetical protein
MVNIINFIIFLLLFIYDPFVNVVCGYIIYHKFKLNSIGKIWYIIFFV